MTTADVIRHVRCELRDAVWSYPDNVWVQQWNAALVFEFEVYHVGGLDNDNSLVFPLSQGATFPLGLTAGFNGSGTRVERIYFNEALENLKDFQNCRAERHDRLARLGGELGIGDLFERTGRSVATAKIASEDLTQLDYNITYVIKLTATATPRFQLVPIGPEKTLTSSVRWGGEFRDTQLLKITLKPPVVERKLRCKEGIEPVNGVCPIPVYEIVPQKAAAAKPKAGRRSFGRGDVGEEPAAPPTRRQSISPADKDALERGSTRNILNDIDAELRRQRLGN